MVASATTFPLATQTLRNTKKLAEIKAKEIEKDILYERFDPNNLDKYKPQSALSTVTPVTPITPPQPTLIELWEKYMDFKRPSGSFGTSIAIFNRCLSRYKGMLWCPAMTRRQKHPLRDLTTEERQELERLARASSESAARVVRAKALLAVAEGQSYTAAAQASGRRSGDAVG